MDNEYLPPHSEPAEAELAAQPPEAAAVIEQVRELLFGDHRRATEGSLKSLEDRLAALTATIEARFADLERRLREARAETDYTQHQNVEAIGDALAELGDRIKNLIPKPQ